MATPTFTTNPRRLPHRGLFSFLPLLALFCLLPALVTSSPIPTTPITNPSPFCRSRSAVNHAYNIGDDFYLVAGSQSIYAFNGTEGVLYPKKHTMTELFGKNFQWVDTSISLAGFCQKSPLCQDETWRDLERLYVVIGQRRFPATKENGKEQKVYGYTLYDYDQTTSSLRLLSLANVEQPLVDKLAKIGLPLKKDEQEAVLMIGDFWPRFSDQYYYQSGMFFPEKGELLFNVYAIDNARAPRQILRRRFSNGAGSGSEEWAPMDLESLDSAGSNFDFTGMFRLNGQTYALNNKNNFVYELSWSGDDKLQLTKLVPMPEFVNCYKNSSVIEELEDAKRKEAINRADPSENSVKAEVSSTKASTTTTTTTTSTTTTTTTTSTTQRPTTTEPDVVMLDSDSTGSHHHHDSHHHNHQPEPEVNSNRVDSNKSGEIIEREDPDTESRTDGGVKKEEDSEFDVPAQSDDPRTHTLAEASARGPFNPNDDGLIWTFSILVGVLILLTIIILIPILIIRHNARSDRMYINKTTKKPPQASQNSEEVQLMNSSNIEK